MQTVDEQPETIHLYVVRDADNRPPIYPIVLSALALVTLVVLCSLTQFQQPVTRVTLRVPAVLLQPKTFTAKVAIIPTGRKTYPATTARGVLTITNGSVIAQVIPAGFTVQHVATDTVVFVPAGSADGYGVATVSAHALVSGIGGNFARLAVNQVIGSSVYIRNLAAFQGGRDAYSVKFATAQDKQAALTSARSALIIIITGLHYPCLESISGAISVTWRCQMLTYHIPAFYHVTGVKIIGKNLLIDVWFVVHPIRIWVK